MFSMYVMDTRLTKKVKNYALTHGADLVGILKPDLIDTEPEYFISWQIQEPSKKTRDYMQDAKSIIMLGYHAFDDIHEVSMSRKGSIEYPVYQRMRLFARRVLRFLEDKGYECVVYPFNLSQKKMAQLSGLGSIGKNSLVINPKFGPWIRFQSILTNAPLQPDKSFTKDLCVDCSRCVEACPTGALTPYHVDPDRCLVGIYETDLSRLIDEDLPFSEFKDTSDEVFREHMPRFTKNSILMCTTCQKVCPYGKEFR